jgi:hypothetical protein
MSVLAGLLLSIHTCMKTTQSGETNKRMKKKKRKKANKYRIKYGIKYVRQRVKR